jgi:hypothetical protein
MHVRSCVCVCVCVLCVPSPAPWPAWPCTCFTHRVETDLEVRLVEVFDVLAKVLREHPCHESLEHDCGGGRRVRGRPSTPAQQAKVMQEEKKWLVSEEGLRQRQCEGADVVPAQCARRWMYVNATTVKNNETRVHRSWPNLTTTRTHHTRTNTRRRRQLIATRCVRVMPTAKTQTTRGQSHVCAEAIAETDV